MSTFEVIATITAALTLLVNIILFVIVVHQLRAARAQLADSRDSTVKDHERRKKQATLDYHAMTIEKRNSLAAALPYDRDAKAIAHMTRRLGQQNSPKVNQVVEYLDLFENLATGVRTDIFDIEVIEGIATGQIQALARNYRPWIEQRRIFYDSPKLYCELFALAEELSERYPAYLDETAKRQGAI